MERPTDLPEPAGVPPVRGGRLTKRLVLFGIVIALTIAAILVPIPIFYSYLPGPVSNVERLVSVDGMATYSSEGELLLTTVSVDVDVTFLEVVQTIVDPHSRIVMKEQVTGGLSLEELEAAQFAAMDESQNAAMQVALSALGLASPTSDGIRIEDTSPGTDAARSLRPGDRVVEIDGSSVATSCDVGRAIDAHEPGEDVSITVLRGRREREFAVTTVPSPQDPTQPLAGIFMSDINFAFDPGIDIEFDTGRIAGPSAGLMMTLALYDRLTPEDLTSGKKIAGTGEISCDGGVTAIGGIEQKVAGAEAKGAEIFLAPAGNLDVALRAAGEIEVVPVSNFADAIEYLTGLS